MKRGRNPKLTDEAVLQAHSSAKTSMEMASMLAVSESTIHRYQHRLGLRSPRALRPPKPRLPRPLNRERQDQLEHAFAAGWRSLQSVGDELGLTRERVRQLCVRYGIQRATVPSNRPTCSRCGVPIAYTTKSGLCHKHHYPKRLVYCSWCHKPKVIGGAVYRAGLKPNPLRQGERTLHFCNRQCNGFWLAANHGIGTPNGTVPPKGASHHNAKLTEDQVRAIRLSGEPQRALAARFHISQTTVSHIRSRRIWKHL